MREPDRLDRMLAWADRLTRQGGLNALVGHAVLHPEVTLMAAAVAVTFLTTFAVKVG